MEYSFDDCQESSTFLLSSSPASLIQHNMTKVITITGAGGRIAYALIPLIAQGGIFGKEVCAPCQLQHLYRRTGMMFPIFFSTAYSPQTSRSTCCYATSRGCSSGIGGLCLSFVIYMRNY